MRLLGIFPPYSADSSLSLRMTTGVSLRMTTGVSLRMTTGVSLGMTGGGWVNRRVGGSRLFDAQEIGGLGSLAIK